MKGWFSFMMSIPPVAHLEQFRHTACEIMIPSGLSVFENGAYLSVETFSIWQSSSHSGSVWPVDIRQEFVKLWPSSPMYDMSIRVLDMLSPNPTPIHECEAGAFMW